MVIMDLVPNLWISAIYFTFIFKINFIPKKRVKKYWIYSRRKLIQCTCYNTISTLKAIFLNNTLCNDISVSYPTLDDVIDHVDSCNCKRHIICHKIHWSWLEIQHGLHGKIHCNITPWLAWTISTEQKSYWWHNVHYVQENAFKWDSINFEIQRK